MPLIDNPHTLQSPLTAHQVKNLSIPTPLIWSSAVVVDWAVIGCTIAIFIYVQNIFTFLLALFIVGNRQHALAILGHDGAHYCVHHNRRLNDFLGNLFCFWPLFLTVSGYRALHFKHHNHTGTSKDPELQHKKARAPQWDLPLNMRKFLFYLIKDLFGYSLPDLMIILSFSRPSQLRQLLPIVGLHVVFITLSLVFGSWLLPLLWYLPITTTFMMFFRLRLWIEHQGTTDTQRVKLNRVSAIILAPHNIWLHWEHHKFPTVPFSQLTHLRSLLIGPTPIKIKSLIKSFSQSSYLPSGFSIDSE